MEDPRDLRVVEVARERAHQLDDLLRCSVQRATVAQAHDLAIGRCAALPDNAHAMVLVVGPHLHLVDQRA